MALVDDAERTLADGALAEATAGLRALEARALARSAGPRPTEEVRQAVWALEDAATVAQREAEDARTRAVQALRSALSHAPGLPEADHRLAELFHARHVALEAAGREEDARAVAADLAHHDVAGRYTAYLQGAGAVTLVTEPAGARVERWRLVERHRRRTIERDGDLGATPLVEAPLPRGDWVLRVLAEGRPAVSIPVSIGRNEHWDGRPPGADRSHAIPLPATLAADEVYVPAGWFRAGTTRFQHAHPSPVRRMWVDGFVMGRFPVTLGEYLRFLESLVEEGHDEEAERWQPRVAENDEPLLERDGERFVGIRRDRSGSGWDHLPRGLDVPVTMVDWASAVAYATWRARRESLPWRLPTDLEWEKAARGTDGREYPWGDHFEVGWCRSQGTGDPATTCAVTEYPTDESPYGARGMAGNVQEWLLGVHDPEQPEQLAADEPGRRWAAGGFASAGPTVCSATYRTRSVDYFRGPMRGFRLVRPV
jgi:formylglycine-generating enzyme required for sulfatase activity